MDAASLKAGSTQTMTLNPSKSNIKSGVTNVNRYSRIY